MKTVNPKFLRLGYFYLLGGASAGWVALCFSIYVIAISL